MQFKFSAKITVSAYTVVEADNLEDALEEARLRTNADIHINGGYEENEYWIVEEIDGEAQDIILDSE